MTVGGTIPADDVAELKALGVAEVFTPGAPTQAGGRLHPRRGQGAGVRVSLGGEPAHATSELIDSSVNRVYLSPSFKGFRRPT